VAQPSADLGDNRCEWLQHEATEARHGVTGQAEDMLDTLVSFGSLVALGILANLWLFRFYRREALSGPAAAREAWRRKWEFSPADLGGFSYRQLALVSVLGLFLELLMIRWISSQIPVFAYFKNFVLIACFLGFGLGCYLARRRISLLPLIMPLVTLAVVIHVPGLRQLLGWLPYFIGPTSEVNIWGVPNLPVGTGLILFFGAVCVIVPLFSIVAFAFIPIGQLVGWFLENAPNGIFGYTVNVLASLAGIALYTLLCFLFQPPAVWFLLAGGMLVLLFWRLPRLRRASAVALLICVALASIGEGKNSKVYWSPYQKLTLTPVRVNGETVSYSLETNGGWYQQIFNLSPAFVAAHTQLFRGRPIEWNAYNVPYRFYPRPPAVLVLGAGTGNDVAAALRNGAGSVTAVEIDPLILKLGRRLHFEKPYSSPRVRVVVNDARSYVQNTNARFDLIVFSLLDSHTTSSYYSNIRIDNYVYTVEALRAARRLLEPDGVFMIKFDVTTPWIAGRLRSLCETVFGRPPLELQTSESGSSLTTTPGRFFITGSEARIAGAMADPAVAAYVQSHQNFKISSAALTTDDWPYFYQREPGLPFAVLVISLVLVLLCGLFLRQTGTAVRSLRWHFFFLGGGFLLLEAQIISKMALLFGTTWVVNSIVIAALLLLIVAANFLVAWRPRIPVTVGYAGIFLTIAVGYLVPLEKFFFFTSLWVKAVAATAVLCAPVLFAGIVFIRSFAREGFRGEALGSNLLGALVGGMLESLSMWTGIRSLLLLAAVLYAASWIALRAQAPLAEAGSQAREVEPSAIEVR
jgi:SAM-dependent methyltransferase